MKMSELLPTKPTAIIAPHTTSPIDGTNTRGPDETNENNGAELEEQEEKTVGEDEEEKENEALTMSTRPLTSIVRGASFQLGRAPSVVLLPIAASDQQLMAEYYTPAQSLAVGGDEGGPTTAGEDIVPGSRLPVPLATPTPAPPPPPPLLPPSAPPSATLPAAEKTREYTADEHLMSLAEVARRYGTHINTSNIPLSQGLDAQEWKKRLATNGPNVLTPPPDVPEIIKFLRQFGNLFLVLLEIAVILAFVAYGLNRDTTNVILAGCLIVLITLTAGMNYYQEKSSGNVINSIRSLLPAQCRVIRSGKEYPTSTETLVVGDLVHLTIGNRVPADIRILEAHDFKVEMSSLTGESDAIECGPEKRSDLPVEARNIIFNSTLVMNGECRGIVIRCGDATMIGSIAGLAGATHGGKTTMEIEILRMVHFIAALALITACSFFAIGLGRGLGVVFSFVNAFILVLIANVPEGLPATVTSILNVTAQRLAQQNVFIKRTDLIETLGSASVICSDKTGTLTQNRMTVTNLWFNQHFARARGEVKHVGAGAAATVKGIGRRPIVAAAAAAGGGGIVVPSPPSPSLLLPPHPPGVPPPLPVGGAVSAEEEAEEARNLALENMTIGRGMSFLALPSGDTTAIIHSTVRRKPFEGGLEAAVGFGPGGTGGIGVGGGGVVTLLSPSQLTRARTLAVAPMAAALAATHAASYSRRSGAPPPSLSSIFPSVSVAASAEVVPPGGGPEALLTVPREVSTRSRTEGIGSRTTTTTTPPSSPSRSTATPTGGSTVTTPADVVIVVPAPGSHAALTTSSHGEPHETITTSTTAATTSSSRRVPSQMIVTELPPTTTSSAPLSPSPSPSLAAAAAAVSIRSVGAAGNELTLTGFRPASFLGAPPTSPTTKTITMATLPRGTSTATPTPRRRMPSWRGSRPSTTTTTTTTTTTDDKTVQEQQQKRPPEDVTATRDEGEPQLDRFQSYVSFQSFRSFTNVSWSQANAFTRVCTIAAICNAADFSHEDESQQPLPEASNTNGGVATSGAISMNEEREGGVRWYNWFTLNLPTLRRRRHQQQEQQQEQEIVTQQTTQGPATLEGGPSRVLRPIPRPTASTSRTGAARISVAAASPSHRGNRYNTNIVGDEEDGKGGADEDEGILVTPSTDETALASSLVRQRSAPPSVMALSDAEASVLRHGGNTLVGREAFPVRRGESITRFESVFGKAVPPKHIPADTADTRKVLGDATSAALLRYIDSLAPIAEWRSAYPVLFEVPFNSVTKWSAVVTQMPEEEREFGGGGGGGSNCREEDHTSSSSSSSSSSFPLQQQQHSRRHHLIFVKGAPERIIDKCTYHFENGSEEVVNDEFRKRWGSAYERFGVMGERVLGFAYKLIPAADDIAVYKQEGGLPLHDLVFAGLISLVDPPKDGVPEAISKCRAASIKVTMVTGDHPLTAEAIARKVGIVTMPTAREIAAADGVDESEIPYNDERVKAIVLPGYALPALSEGDWDTILSKPEVVFARTSPQQKLQIVEHYQRLGHVVAVTGDGTNDAPALKRAQIGVSMGSISASDVAREAADMVLMTDDFASIVFAIEMGRTVFDNIKKTVAYTVAHLWPELIPVFITLTFDVPLMLPGLLILLIDLVTEQAPAISLSKEPSEASVMARPPRNIKTERLIDLPLILYSYIVIGVLETLACILAFFTVFSYYGVSANLVGYHRELWTPDSPSVTLSDGTVLNGQEQDYIYRRAVAAYFLTLVLCQGWHIWLCKTRRVSIFKHPVFQNRITLYGVIAAVIVACVVTYVPAIQDLFLTYYLLIIWWTPFLTFAAVSLIYTEWYKWRARVNPTGFVARWLAW